MKFGKPTFILACLNWHGSSGFFSILPSEKKEFRQSLKKLRFSHLMGKKVCRKISPVKIP